jgi:hypothetical protein
MMGGGFLDPGVRQNLIARVRDGKAEKHLTRRATSLRLLDEGGGRVAESDTQGAARRLLGRRKT